MEKFVFGGELYVLMDRVLLQGMEYYRVLANVDTGEKLYLYCFSDR